jgi:hypothetical protein
MVHLAGHVFVNHECAALFRLLAMASTMAFFCKQQQQQVSGSEVCTVFIVFYAFLIHSPKYVENLNNQVESF